MPSRKQRTKQLNSLTFKRIDALFEISKTQSIVRISVRFIFESKSSSFQFITESMTDVQNTVSLSEDIDIDMNLPDDVTGQDDFIEQMEQRLATIEAEKRRAHLRHRLA